MPGMRRCALLQELVDFGREVVAVMAGGPPGQQVFGRVEFAGGVHGPRIFDSESREQGPHAGIVVAVGVGHAPHGIAGQRLKFTPVIQHLPHHHGVGYMRQGRVRGAMGGDLMARHQLG